ncbi:hypothetical protein [Metabacillus niabensis]|uniref:Uncharacterized protein n=1 Tax=Metabacillus niabensis TaxID=324854 RepID=A0ABT9Z3S3_9BACI|nr:hypothetical protein [Metabacillus niabensis]MDQ0226506.1 hypothetical protein [Metabacillus niabensis]
MHLAKSEALEQKSIRTNPNNKATKFMRTAYKKSSLHSKQGNGE